MLFGLDLSRAYVLIFCLLYILFEELSLRKELFLFLPHMDVPILRFYINPSVIRFGQESCSSVTNSTISDNDTKEIFLQLPSS